MSDPIEEYLNLRRRIDRETERLADLYGPDITCRAGCAHCCVNLTVFPVEFFAMQREMREAYFDLQELAFSEKMPCGFLEEGLCRIYPYRPIICRTHGLPILFIDDSPEDPSWQVSCCEFNFSDSREIEFDDEGLLHIETINAELNRINKDFIITLPQSGYDRTARIPLRNLCTEKRKGYT